MRDVALKSDGTKRKYGMKIEKDVIEDKHFGRKKRNETVLFCSVLCSQYQIFPRSRGHFSTLKKEPKNHFKTRMLICYTTLHYTTLHYTTLRYATLHLATLHCTKLHYATLHYATLHYTILHYTTIHYHTLHYITLRYTCIRCHENLQYKKYTLHYTTLHYDTLPYTTLHYATLHVYSLP